MKNRSRPQQENSSRRKFLTLFGALFFLYPLLQFVGYKIPRKPTYINIDKPVPDAGFLVNNEFILFDREDKCWALSRKCTHLGCKLNYLEEEDILECPCHQSRFHVETGEVIKGPADKPLAFFPVEKRENEPLYVVTT